MGLFDAFKSEPPKLTARLTLPLMSSQPSHSRLSMSFSCHGDAPAQVNVHQFDESVFKPSAQCRKYLAHKQIPLLAEVSEGAGEKDSYAS